MPTQSLIMPAVIIVLALLPIRLSSLQLLGLAFLLWFTGGLILAWRGANFLFTDPGHPGVTLLTVLVLAALVVGWAKGKFVLTKTSRKNIDRLEALSEPQRPIYVYSLRSWIIIAVMIGISAALNIFQVSPLVRGPINLGIGVALIVSSLAYIRALVPMTPPSTPSASE